MSADRMFSMEQIAEVLAEGAYDTKWSRYEIYLLGEALLDWCNTVVVMGHSNPGSTLDYANRHTGSAPHDFLADFVVWTSGRKKMLPGAEDRIRHEMVDSGWSKAAAKRLGARFDGIFSQAGDAA